MASTHKRNKLSTTFHRASGEFRPRLVILEMIASKISDGFCSLEFEDRKFC